MQQAARIHPQTRCWGRVSRLTGHKQREAAFPGNTRPPRNHTRLSGHRRFRSPRQGLGRDTALAVPAATPVPALLGPPLPPTARPRRPDQNQPSRPRPWRGSPRPYLTAGAILTAYGNAPGGSPQLPAGLSQSPALKRPTAPRRAKWRIGLRRTGSAAGPTPPERRLGGGTDSVALPAGLPACSPLMSDAPPRPAPQPRSLPALEYVSRALPRSARFGFFSRKRSSRLFDFRVYLVVNYEGSVRRELPKSLLVPFLVRGLFALSAGLRAAVPIL